MWAAAAAAVTGKARALFHPSCGCARMRVEHGAVCMDMEGRVQDSTMRAYNAAALLSAVDVQVRGDGGVAEHLHASCRHLDAVADVQGCKCKRGQAQCSHSLVRHQLAAVELERGERRQHAHCSHTRVRHLDAVVRKLSAVQFLTDRSPSSVTSRQWLRSRDLSAGRPPPSFTVASRCCPRLRSIVNLWTCSLSQFVEDGMGRRGQK